MTTARSNIFWTAVSVLLVSAIIISGIIIWTKYSPAKPIEISLAPPPQLRGEIYVGGAVSNPGFYPLVADDTLQDVIQAAGGAGDSAEHQLELYLRDNDGAVPAQKVNINTAESWLLRALPGIGETRAGAIIDYRRQNGKFRQISKIMKVDGIGSETYENIKDMITVSD